MHAYQYLLPFTQYIQLVNILSSLQDRPVKNSLYLLSSFIRPGHHFLSVSWMIPCKLHQNRRKLICIFIWVSMVIFRLVTSQRHCHFKRPICYTFSINNFLSKENYQTVMYLCRCRVVINVYGFVDKLIEFNKTNWLTLQYLATHINFF